MSRAIHFTLYFVGLWAAFLGFAAVYMTAVYFLGQGMTLAITLLAFTAAIAVTASGD